MTDEKLAAWALSNFDGIGPASFVKLVAKFGSASAVFSGSENQFSEMELTSRNLIKKILSPQDWDGCRMRFEKAMVAGALFVAYTESQYPSKLKNIPDPPPYLYYRGDLGIFEQPSLAIVGSRRPSDYGLRMAARIAGELASAGVVIISGLAYGVDGAAHQATLDAGGKTAAVFGCGLDIVYPSGHRALAARIAESGCLLSEFAKGVRPERFNFPVRNRIVAGLADGVLVVEAGEKSGALVTAGIALEQGKDILALPGSVDCALSYGPNSLIKQGAVTVTSADDIFDNFGWYKSRAFKEPPRDLSKLSKDELAIFHLLSVQPVHLDEIGRKAQLGPGKTAEVLLNLELKGLIIRRPGNFVVIA
jgi:DNA processing protein